MESARLRRFKLLADSSIAVGYIQHGTGRPMASFVFPEGEPKRYDVGDLGGYGIELLEEDEASNEPSASEVKSQAENDALRANIESLESALSASQEENNLLQNELEILKRTPPVLPTPTPTPEPQGEQTPSDGSQGSGDAPNEAVDESAAIEAYLKESGLDVTNKSVIEALKEKGVVVQSAQVTAVKNKLANQTVA